VREEYLTKMSTEEDDEESPDEEWDVVNKSCQSCRKCPPSVVIMSYKGTCSLTPI